MFDPAPEKLARRPGCRIEPAAMQPFAFKPAFEPAEDMVEKNGLRTGPAAPDAAEQGGEEKQREAEAGDEKKKQPQVLGGERPAEEMETPVGQVEKDGRISADFDPRQQRIKRDEAERTCSPPAAEAPAHVGRMQKKPRTVAANGGDRIEVGNRRSSLRTAGGGMIRSRGGNRWLGGGGVHAFGGDSGRLEKAAGGGLFSGGGRAHARLAFVVVAQDVGDDLGDFLFPQHGPPGRHAFQRNAIGDGVKNVGGPAAMNP